MEANSEVSGMKRNFILQQGFADPIPQSCGRHYSALLFQSRLVGLAVLIGTVFQWPAVFLTLTAVLWWSALLPKWNPFDALYNYFWGSKAGAIPLSPAPGPRRFAQGVAGFFNLMIWNSLMLGWHVVAYVLEGVMIVSVCALIFGGFCLGSFIYHYLAGRGEFAKRTLPWVKPK